MDRTITPLSELPLRHDFMFGQVMHQPEICRIFLEELLGIKIDRIEYIDRQKDLTNSYEFHGSRLDIYVYTCDGTVYNIEMENGKLYLKSSVHVIEKRGRYYQMAIDRKGLEKGKDYSSLSDSYLIFVCNSDFIGDGFAVYTRKAYWEPSERLYQDGSHFLLLNSHYTKGNASTAILEFLDYIRTNDDNRDYQSALVRKAREQVRIVRADKELEVQYMTLEMKILDERRMARQEGIEQGRRELIQRMLKNTDLSTVAKFLGMSEEEVERYCNP